MNASLLYDRKVPDAKRSPHPPSRSSTMEGTSNGETKLRARWKPPAPRRRIKAVCEAGVICSIGIAPVAITLFGRVSLENVALVLDRAQRPVAFSRPSACPQSAFCPLRTVQPKTSFHCSHTYL